jgi:DNA-binding CsgD family transcriptional regulator/PAS domain-containing protein
VIVIKNSQKAAKTYSHVDSLELRRVAEAQLGAFPEAVPRAVFETTRLFHELDIYKLELEMQNKELCKARDDMETMLARYTDLFEFAPISYFILDCGGLVVSANLMGSGLLGIEPLLLKGRRFEHFLSAASRPDLAGFLERVFKSLVRETCEVVLQKEDESQILVQIEALATGSGLECRVALMDITERKRAVESLRKEKEATEALLKMGEVAEALRKMGEAALVGLISTSIPEGPVSSCFKSISKISLRENQVLRLLAEGNCTKEVASLLSISCKTVEMHRINMMKKLEISNMVDLVKFAIREGLIEVV